MMGLFYSSVILSLWFTLVMLCKSNDVFEVDQNGYIIFCLCMGRLGNQMEHFLGALAFAKAVNRTLILPPFRTYKNVEYDEWFDVSAVRQYHRVILAKDFMEHLAPKVWPPEKRYGFCYVFPNDKNGCEMKIGNPFTNFWDELNVDFVKTIPYSITYQTPMAWNVEFPPDKYPVLALRGAPASFPMSKNHLELQKYVQFSKAILDQVDNLIAKQFNGSRNYVGVHLRNGEDWINTCKLVDSVPRLMSSYQCTGYDNQKKLTYEMCFPSKDEVLRKTKQVMESTEASHLFIATDKNPYTTELQNILSGVKVVHLDPWLPLIDVVMLSESKYFLGNCVSSFSSFVWRHRMYHNKGPSNHFGID